MREEGFSPYLSTRRSGNLDLADVAEPGLCATNPPEAEGPHPSYDQGAPMRLTMCKAKLHRAAVTEARLDYEGSITIDKDLLEASGILPFEKVQVVNINNGARFETYTYAGEPGSGVVCVNGAAARLVQVGDKVIIIAYCDVDAEEARSHKPRLVLLDDENQVREILDDVPMPIAQGHGHRP